MSDETPVTLGDVVDESVDIVVCPDGPLLVRGPARVLASDGTPYPRSRRTVALCRCGRSGLAPWCDGTHKVVGFAEPAVPVPTVVSVAGP